MPSDQQKEGDRRMKERWWEKSESAEEPARRVACRELRVVKLQRCKLVAGRAAGRRELGDA